MNNLNPTVGLMYFSPTGTTRKICEEIAKSISTESPIRMDLTRPKKPEPKDLEKADIWVVGVPVYASRMPTIAHKRMALALENFSVKTRAIAVAVYGNVDAGIALKQLVELLSGRGLTVVGAGEFIGQHWFKKFHGIDPKGTVGRPNEDDFAVARELGTSVLKEKLDGQNNAPLDSVRLAKISLKFKFTGEDRVLGLLGPSTIDSSKCTKCQACVKICPVACIDPQTLTSNDGTEKCIGCGNCMKVCPNNARSQSIKMKWLVKRMANPKNPAGKSTYYV